MRILQVHNKYKKRGGEETVVEEERKLLESNGHEVVQYLKDSTDLEAYSKLELAKLMLSQRYSRKSAEEIRQIIEKVKPDICHVHNVFPIITPAVYQVCKDLEVPVVQTLHNYKLLCTNSLLFREGEVCENCVGKSLLNSIRYKCYRNSFLTTAITADALQYHRNHRTWTEDIDRYVCLTDFHKQKILDGGILPEKITVKPNFLEPLSLEISYGQDILFVGRLDDSKGLQDLLFAIRECPNIKFTLIGESDNPSIFEAFKNANYLGPQSREIVLEKMATCRAVLFPSKYYEGMPMVILEAFSMKKAVIARNVGAMSSMINNGVNGLSYQSRSELILGLNALDNEALAKSLGEGAFKDFEINYTKETGYTNLIGLYTSVIEEKNGIRKI